MRKCFLCDAVGIQTIANSPQPIVVSDKSFVVCNDCYNSHEKALQRGLRTMFERLFPSDFRKIKARADARPRAIKQDEPPKKPHTAVEVTTVVAAVDTSTGKGGVVVSTTVVSDNRQKAKLTIFPAE